MLDSWERSIPTEESPSDRRLRVRFASIKRAGGTFQTWLAELRFNCFDLAGRWNIREKTMVARIYELRSFEEGSTSEDLHADENSTQIRTPRSSSVATIIPMIISKTLSRSSSFSQHRDCWQAPDMLNSYKFPRENFFSGSDTHKMILATQINTTSLLGREDNW